MEENNNLIPKINKEEKVFDDYFEIYKGHLQDVNKEEEYVRLKLKRPNAVACLLFNQDEGTFIFVEQFRYPSYSQSKEPILEIPAGKLDGEEETERVAMKREILEETGYKVRELEYIYYSFSSPGYSSEKTHLFFSVVSNEDKQEKGGGVEEENENINIVEIPYEKTFELLKDNYFQDMKTILALESAYDDYIDNLMQEKEQTIENKNKEINDLKMQIKVLKNDPKNI